MLKLYNNSKKYTFHCIKYCIKNGHLNVTSRIIDHNIRVALLYNLTDISLFTNLKRFKQIGQSFSLIICKKNPIQAFWSYKVEILIIKKLCFRKIQHAYFFRYLFFYNQLACGPLKNRTNSNLSNYISPIL